MQSVDLASIVVGNAIAPTALLLKLTTCYFSSSLRLRSHAFMDYLRNFPSLALQQRHALNQDTGLNSNVFAP
jgi:hypothetical protein